MDLKKRDFKRELEFKSSRSSGKGGQHVNKVESRVSLFFNLMQSGQLSPLEKEKLLEFLKGKISKEGVLQLDVDEGRSQHQNKKIAIERFYELLELGLKEKKKRKITKPGQAAIRKRLKEKKIQSEKKKNRKNDWL